jgi:hypothetical protein
LIVEAGLFRRKDIRIPVLVTLVLLAGLAADTLSRPRPKDADQFHAKVYDGVTAIPLTIGGTWRGSVLPDQPAAVKLLRPNVMLHRRYVSEKHPGRAVDFLLVHCRDARDMTGHYPPNCYPAHGYTSLGGLKASPVEWRVGDRVIEGMEYGYTRMDDGRVTACVVSNLLVLPNGRFVRGMTEVREAAADYLRQFYGAAQVQIVMDATVPEEERREIVSEFLVAIAPVLDLLSSRGIQ